MTKFMVLKAAGDPQNTLTMLLRNSLLIKQDRPMKTGRQFGFYDNKLSNSLLSLIDASHKF